MAAAKTLLIFTLLLVPVLYSFSAAEEEAQLDLGIGDAAIAREVINREPQGGSESFPADVSRVFAFTEITGASDGASVKHLWFHGDRLMASVELPIGSSRWRTWSSKKILPPWTGKWRVDVTAEDGRLLKSLEFTIE
jgi:hypothetical protein